MNTEILSESAEEQSAVQSADEIDEHEAQEQTSSENADAQTAEETVTTQTTVTAVYASGKPEAAVASVYERTRRETSNVRKKPHPGIFILRGAGAVSVCVSAMFMAVVLMLCLFVPDFDVTLLAKLSPVPIVLTAAELLFAFTKCKNGVRVNVVCIVMSILIAGGCFFGGITVGNSYEEEERTSAELRLESEIYSACYSELKYVSSISLFRTDVKLNSYSPRTEYAINSVGAGNTITVDIEYKSFSGSKKRFAEQCRTIMDTFRMLGISATSFRFSCEDEFSSLSLDVEGRYQQDYSVDELAEMTHEIIAIDRNYFDDVTTEEISSQATQEVTVDETYEFNIGEE